MKELLDVWIKLSYILVFGMIMLFLLAYKPGVLVVLFVLAIVLGCVAGLGCYIWERML